MYNNKRTNSTNVTKNTSTQVINLLKDARESLLSLKVMTSEIYYSQYLDLLNFISERINFYNTVGEVTDYSVGTMMIGIAKRTVYHNQNRLILVNEINLQMVADDYAVKQQEYNNTVAELNKQQDLSAECKYYNVPLYSTKAELAEAVRKKAIQQRKLVIKSLERGRKEEVFFEGFGKEHLDMYCNTLKKHVQIVKVYEMLYKDLIILFEALLGVYSTMPKGWIHRFFHTCSTLYKQKGVLLFSYFSNMDKMRPFLAAFGVFLIGFFSVLAEIALISLLNDGNLSVNTVVLEMVSRPFFLVVFLAGCLFMGWGVGRAITILENKHE